MQKEKSERSMNIYRTWLSKNQCDRGPDRQRWIDNSQTLSENGVHLTKMMSKSPFVL
jgi:hypothetical protein